MPAVLRRIGPDFTRPSGEVVEPKATILTCEVCGRLASYLDTSVKPSRAWCGMDESGEFACGQKE